MSRAALPIESKPVQVSVRVLPNMIARSKELIDFVQSYRRTPTTIVDVAREAWGLGLEELERRRLASLAAKDTVQ